MKESIIDSQKTYEKKYLWIEFHNKIVYCFCSVGFGCYKFTQIGISQVLFHLFVIKKYILLSSFPLLNPNVSPQESQSFSEADNNLEWNGKKYTWEKRGQGDIMEWKRCVWDSWYVDTSQDNWVDLEQEKANFGLRVWKYAPWDVWGNIPFKAVFLPL